VTHVEVERKFVLPARPEGLEQHPARRIEQGYLAIDPIGSEVRIRNNDGVLTLTVKAGLGLVRAEEEIPIEPERFEALWPLTAERRVVKTRYLMPLDDGGLVAEIDDYDDALSGLITAEVEFATEAAALAYLAPDWLGREVTGDARYNNRTLAVDGIPD
jgi:CYTH domain-containing protein